MPVICSSMSIFDNQHSVWLMDLENDSKELLGTPSAENFPDFIKAMCYEKDIYEVHLFGMTDYLDVVQQRILETEMRNYGEARIVVEVNQ